MNICVIGKHVYPKDIFSNEQDMKTWRGMAKYFGRLFIIAQSPDILPHFAREKNISIYLIPRLGYINFIFDSVFLGLLLNLLRGIDVFDASEIAGGGLAATILKFLTGKPSIIEVQGEIFRKPHKPECLPIQMTRIYTRMTRMKELLKHLCYSYVLAYSYYFKSKLLQKIGRFVTKRAARVRVISNAIYNQVREQGIPASKIRLVSLRVDLSLFNPLSILRINSFGDNVGITPTPEGRSPDRSVGAKIGYLGRLVDGKGLEDLLSAMSIVKGQMSNVILLIFGQGPLEEKLKKMAAELNIADKIEWRGFVPYSKVPQALAEIDIFVYPSWHEGFGRSIMEALAMEKPVVATRVGGIPDLVKNGENGFLVAPRKPEELAEKIKELIENRELRAKFGKAGREYVSKNFEWNQGIQKFAQLFLELQPSNTNDTNENTNDTNK